MYRVNIMMKHQLGVILVTYNSEDYIKPCLEGIFKQKSQFDLIIIDNCSQDKTREILTEIRKKKYFHLVYSSENHGFGGAVNRIFPYVKSKYMIIANPDTFILDQDFFSKTQKELQERPEIYCIAPLLLYPSMDIIDSLGIVYNPRTFCPVDVMAGKKLSDLAHKEVEILGCTGAMAIFRVQPLREVVNQDGCLFDERYFLYYEDADLSFRMTKKGFKALGIPGLVAYHHRRQSYRQDKKIEALAYYNRLYCLRKNLTLRDFIRGFPVNIIWETGRFIKIVSHNHCLLTYPFLKRLYGNNRKREKLEKE